MKIGYVRCSTEDQNPARQKEYLKTLGCEKVYCDMMSGINSNRPELKEMLSFIREGDVLYVESISRLARSTQDLLTIINQLQEKGVSFVSQKETIDTSSPQGKFMLTVFAALSELEREQIRQRQREGIEIAKREGKYKGRKPISVDDAEFAYLYERYQRKEIKQKDMYSRLHISQSTLNRRMKEYKKTLGD